MKKTFFPLHILYILLEILFISIFFSGVYLVLHGLYLLFFQQNLGSLIMIVVGIIPAIVFFELSLFWLHNIIIFTDDKIIVTGNWSSHKFYSNECVQYKDEIHYDEIENVSLIYTNANSKKKKFKYSRFQRTSYNKFFEFSLKNNDTKWVFLGYCFSKKQQRKMLNLINEKTNLNLSYDNLEIKYHNPKIKT